jgi:hypothetical protein
MPRRNYSYDCVFISILRNTGTVLVHRSTFWVTGKVKAKVQGPKSEVRSAKFEVRSSKSVAILKVQLRTSDLRTSNVALWTLDLGLRTSHFELRTSNVALWTSDFGPWTLDFRP